MVKFVVMSRDAVESLRVAENVKYAVLSISNTGDGPPKIRCGPNLMGVLCVQFDDALVDSVGKRSLNTAQAAQMVRFADRMVADGADVVVVHCEAGISRSAATAAVLSARYGLDNRHLFRLPYLPNRKVLRLLSEVSDGLGEPATGAQ